MSMPSSIASSGTPAWRTPAVIITFGCLFALLSFGPRATFGLFQAPLLNTTGWSRETFGFAVALQNLMWGLGQPFAGAIADKYGSGRVLALGAVLYAIGVALTAFVQTPLHLSLSAGLLMGLGMAAASFSLVLAVFGRTVAPEKRTLAFGLGTAASSLGQFLFAPLGQSFISSYGWQNALLLIATMMILTMLPLSFVLAGKPQPLTTQDNYDQTLTASLKEAFGHNSYVLLVIGFFVCGFHIAFITAHFPAYISDKGIDAQYGGWALAMIGLFNIIGSLMVGFISQRFSKAYVLSFIYALRSLAIIAFILTPISPLTVMLFAASMGLLWLSTVPPTNGLVATMFGTRYLAMLAGIVFLSHQIGAFIGVWLGGLLYDLTRSYDIIWWASVVLGFIAAAVHWPIADKPVDRHAPSCCH